MHGHQLVIVALNLPAHAAACHPLASACPSVASVCCFCCPSPASPLWPKIASLEQPSQQSCFWPWLILAVVLLPPCLHGLMVFGACMLADILCALVCRGVTWDSEQQKWAVQLSIGGGQLQKLGLFESEEDAAEAYDSVAVSMHGPDAATNFATQHGTHTSYGRHRNGNPCRRHTYAMTLPYGVPVLVPLMHIGLPCSPHPLPSAPLLSFPKAVLHSFRQGVYAPSLPSTLERTKLSSLCC